MMRRTDRLLLVNAMLGQFITGFAGRRPARRDRLGPFLVEGDREGRSLFALANREINARLGEAYRGLPAFAMGRFGETVARTDEVV